ncbi:hypothetical protein D3C72_1266550 [compost metagenome]
MRSILVTFTALLGLSFFAACSYENVEESGTALDTLSDKNILNMTDYSVCEEGTKDSPVGHWYLKTRLDGVTSEMTVSVFEDKLRIINVCTNGKNNSIEAQGISKATIDAESINATETSIDEKFFEKKANDNGAVSRNHNACKVSITPGPMKYHFKGQCLVVTQEASGDKPAVEITFVPNH